MPLNSSRNNVLVTVALFDIYQGGHYASVPQVLRRVPSPHAREVRSRRLVPRVRCDVTLRQV